MTWRFDITPCIDMDVLGIILLDATKGAELFRRPKEDA